MASRGVKILVFLCLGGLGAFTPVLAVRYLAGGEMVSALVALCDSTFCFGFAVPQIKLVRGRVKPRVQFDNSGTTFRPDRGVDIPMQIAVGGGVLAGALILVALPMGELAIPIPPNLRYALPFSCAIIVVLGTSTLRRTISRGSTSYLRLTSTGFELVQSWRPQSGEWASVEDVAAEAPHSQKHPASTIAFIMSDGVAPALVAGSYMQDGTALRDLVRSNR